MFPNHFSPRMIFNFVLKMSDFIVKALFLAHENVSALYIFALKKCSLSLKSSKSSCHLRLRQPCFKINFALSGFPTNKIYRF